MTEKLFNPEIPERRTLLRKIADASAVTVATGFFSGFSPFAPGTAGSFTVIVLYYLIPGIFLWRWIWAVWIGLFLVGVYASERCELFWGKDPGKVVIDEITGMMITIGFMPLNMKIVVAGFFLFRLFDIIKPQPARRFESFHGGWGVMADDVAAGVYANIALRLCMIGIPWLTV